MSCRKLPKLTFAAYSKNSLRVTMLRTISKSQDNVNDLHSFESARKVILKSGQCIENRMCAIVLSLTKCAIVVLRTLLLFSSKSTKLSSRIKLLNVENDACLNPYVCAVIIELQRFCKHSVRNLTSFSSTFSFLTLYVSMNALRSFAEMNFVIISRSM